MKAKSVYYALLASGLVLTTAAFASNHPTLTNNIPLRFQNHSLSPVEYGELHSLLVDAATAPIRSEAQLQTYLAAHPLGTSPLDVLSLEARQRFLASLEFNRKGLATFEYGDLQNELSPTQIYAILALFGVQKYTAMMTDAHTVTSTDALIMSTVSPLRAFLKDHYCFNKGSCAPAIDWACTTNC